MAEANLRNALDSTVEKIIKKLDKKTFLESFPKEIDKEYLTKFHARLQDIIKPKLSEMIEGKLEEYKVIEKLAELDSLTSSTEHSKGHQAWRPTSGVTSNGAMVNMTAHDYKVAMNEKQELETMLANLESETEAITTKINEESATVTSNMKLIEDNRNILKRVGQIE